MRIIKWMLSCAVFFTSHAIAHGKSLDGIAAIVNDGIITKSELTEQMQIIGHQIQESGNRLPERTALEKQVLDHLILKEVQLQIARKTGITVSEAALDNTIENIAKQNHMTLTQLRQALAQEGISYKNYRKNIQEQMEINQLQQRDIINQLQVSEQEISQFLNSPNGLGGMTHEFRLGHILVPLPDSPSPQEIDQAAQKANAIITRLRKGEDFYALAFAESSGEHALQGGDLGWRKLAELPTIFEKIATTLKVEDVPQPIRSGSGFHIIKLLDKRTATQSQSAVQKHLVRHILIKTNAATADKDAQQRLTELRQKILAGESFATLAKAHSADLGSASNGGSIGWVSKEILVPEFSEQMERLPLKELSQPFKSSFGWHLVEVLERKTETNDEVALRQKAREMLQQRKFEEKLQTWARQLQDEAYIKKYAAA